MTTLDLGDNAIESLTPLQDLTSLTSLDLADNLIMDVSALSGLSNLERLDLRDNNVGDVTPLSTLTSLTHLYLRGNDNLTNVKQLAKLTSTAVDIDVPEAVNVPDNGLADAIRSERSLPTGDPIFPEDMEALGSLTASNRGISDLTGLETATALTSLTLSNNDIMDVSPLSGLTSLETLILSNNDIRDVAPLAELTSLTRLDLFGNNNIANPGALYQLNQQPTTTINGVTIPDAVDITNDDLAAAVRRALRIPIGGAILPDKILELERLTVTRKGIADLTGLEHATNLETLDLGDNNLGTNNAANLRLLSNLLNLTTLDLADNQITDVSLLTGLTSLTSLDLRDNTIGDVTQLSTITTLKRLCPPW